MKNPGNPIWENGRARAGPFAGPGILPETAGNDMALDTVVYKTTPNRADFEIIHGPGNKRRRGETDECFGDRQDVWMVVRPIL